MWARIYGERSKYDAKHSLTGATSNSTQWNLKTGFDGSLYESADSAVIAGLNVQYGQIKSDIKSIYGNGNIDTTGYGFGATLSWYGSNGVYLDGQANAIWFDSNLTSDRLGEITKGNKGFGYSFGLEIGKQFALTPEWSVTPQVQLTYANVDFDRFQDRYDNPVHLDQGDQLQGRFGVSLDHKRMWQAANGLYSRTHFYGIANIYYDFLDRTDINLKNTIVFSENTPLWGGVGLGGNYSWDNDKYAIFGETMVETSLENFGDSYSFSGRLGFKVNW